MVDPRAVSGTIGGCERNSWIKMNKFTCPCHKWKLPLGVGTSSNWPRKQVPEKMVVIGGGVRNLRLCDLRHFSDRGT